MARMIVLLFSLLVLPMCTGASIPLHNLQLPPGFKISLFAEDVDNARAMALGDNGVLFVGSRRAGKVHAVVDTDKDGVADEVKLIARNLKMPSGLAFRNGSLYVGAVSTIYRYDNIEARLDNPPEPVVITDDLPTDEHHGWKYLGFGPDGKLYVPVGAPCNVCDEAGYSVIKRMNADGSDVEDYALGVRNSVGFDWHPDTRDLWFTDNGRDWLGDDRPPCELNHASQAGQHFGFPFCHGDDIVDPEFGQGRACSEFSAPAQKLGAHVAPLGMRFYRGDMFPDKYRSQIFIAEHGSWNRSEKSGYRITLVELDGNQAVSYEPFVTGWLDGDESWGRPVDLLLMPDGSMLISDDKAGAIYRITYSQAESAPE